MQLNSAQNYKRILNELSSEKSTASGIPAWTNDLENLKKAARKSFNDAFNPNKPTVTWEDQKSEQIREKTELEKLYERSQTMPAYG